jgi:hypothetical protein
MHFYALFPCLPKRTFFDFGDGLSYAALGSREPCLILQGGLRDDVSDLTSSAKRVFLSKAFEREKATCLRTVIEADNYNPVIDCHI